MVSSGASQLSPSLDGLSQLWRQAITVVMCVHACSVPVRRMATHEEACMARKALNNTAVNGKVLSVRW